MTNLEIARRLFEAYDAAMIDHLVRGMPEPRGEDYGFHHGWITVNDQSFCRQDVFGYSLTSDDFPGFD